MKKWEYVSTVLSQMLDKTQKPFVQREICDHIDDRIDYYKSAGYSADESEEKAVEHMGDPIQLGFRMNIFGNEVHSLKFFEHTTAPLLVILILSRLLYHLLGEKALKKGLGCQQKIVRQGFGLRPWWHKILLLLERFSLSRV